MSFGDFLLYAAELDFKGQTSFGNQGFVVSLSKIGRLIMRKLSLLAFERDKFSVPESIWRILALLNPSRKKKKSVLYFLNCLEGTDFFHSKYIVNE